MLLWLVRPSARMQHHLCILYTLPSSVAVAGGLCSEWTPSLGLTSYSCSSWGTVGTS